MFDLIKWMAVYAVILFAIYVVAGYDTDTERPNGAAVFGVVEPGMTTLPECPVTVCDDCRDCQSGTWLAQFVHHLDSLAENPREIRDVLNRCYTETRLTPSSVSDTGDWGICQINRRAWPDVDTARLLDDPEYAASECLRVYRVYFKACGDKWQRCYRRGINGGLK